MVWERFGVTMGRDRRVERDFFISYTQADRAWAEWIAWVLEEDGHKVLIHAWDFVPGSNWIQGMRAGAWKAERTVAVLSPDYLASEFGTAEWEAAWAPDPLGAQRKLLTVRVKDCDRPDFLAAVVSVDLFGISEADARARLRMVVSSAIAGRAKPFEPPGFPGYERAMPREPRFPSAQPRIWKVPADGGADASQVEGGQSEALQAIQPRRVPEIRDGSLSTRHPEIASLMAELYASERAATAVLFQIGFPQNLLPKFTEPVSFWSAVILALQQGLGPVDGLSALITTAATMYPGNSEVRTMQAEWSNVPPEITGPSKKIASEKPRPTLIRSAFVSYSQRDERYRQRLDISLVQLRRNKLISVWHDRKILPGQEWDREIDKNLESADMVLLLVSPDFLASDYAYSREMLRALERHRSGSAMLVPIILRPCDWQESPLGSLQALPSQGRPVSRWPNRDQAWLDIVQGLRRLTSDQG